MTALTITPVCSFNVLSGKDYIVSRPFTEDVHTKWNKIREFISKLIQSKGYIDDEFQEIGMDLIYSSLHFVDLLENDITYSVPNSVTITPEGSLLFIWKSDGLYTEAEIEEPEVVSWMVEMKKGEFHHTEQNLASHNKPADTDLLSEESTIIIPDEPESLAEATLSMVA